MSPDPRQSICCQTEWSECEKGISIQTQTADIGISRITQTTGEDIPEAVLEIILEHSAAQDAKEVVPVEAIVEQSEAIEAKDEATKTDGSPDKWVPPKLQRSDNFSDNKGLPTTDNQVLAWTEYSLFHSQSGPAVFQLGAPEEIVTYCEQLEFPIELKKFTEMSENEKGNLLQPKLDETMTSSTGSEVDLRTPSPEPKGIAETAAEHWLGSKQPSIEIKSETNPSITPKTDENQPGDLPKDLVKDVSLAVMRMLTPGRGRRSIMRPILRSGGRGQTRQFVPQLEPIVERFDYTTGETYQSAVEQSWVLKMVHVTDHWNGYFPMVDAATWRKVCRFAKEQPITGVRMGFYFAHLRQCKDCQDDWRAEITTPFVVRTYKQEMRRVKEEYLEYQRIPQCEHVRFDMYCIQQPWLLDTSKLTYLEEQEVKKEEIEILKRIARIFPAFYHDKGRGVTMSGETIDCDVRWCPNMSWLSMRVIHEKEPVIIATGVSISHAEISNWEQAIEEAERTVAAEVPAHELVFTNDPPIEPSQIIRRALEAAGVPEQADNVVSDGGIAINTPEVVIDNGVRRAVPMRTLTSRVVCNTSPKVAARRPFEGREWPEATTSPMTDRDRWLVHKQAHMVDEGRGYFPFMEPKAWREVCERARQQPPHGRELAFYFQHLRQ